MSIRILNVTRVREDDTFTANNPPELVGHTVWDVEDVPAFGVVALTMVDRTCLSVDRRLAVEIDR